MYLGISLCLDCDIVCVGTFPRSVCVVLVKSMVCFCRLIRGESSLPSLPRNLCALFDFSLMTQDVVEVLVLSLVACVIHGFQLATQYSLDIMAVRDALGCSTKSRSLIWPSVLSAVPSLRRHG